LETYLTVEGLAEYLKFAEQTIRQWVQNREVPYHKIRKGIRFRLSEIEKWIDTGGLTAATKQFEAVKGDLFSGMEDEQDGGAEND
jgi:excisionase family DNA binding protein